MKIRRANVISESAKIYEIYPSEDSRFLPEKMMRELGVLRVNQTGAGVEPVITRWVEPAARLSPEQARLLAEMFELASECAHSLRFDLDPTARLVAG